MARAEELPNKGITIGIAMHKPAPIPHGRTYLPIHVGAAIHPDVLTEIQQDNTGDNISELNPYYCELTALYWLWKNNDSDYKGSSTTAGCSPPEASSKAAAATVIVWTV